jgi:glycosyltransferase involved in cell wall biosynthesis
MAFRFLVDCQSVRLGSLRQHAPKPLRWDSLPWGNDSSRPLPLLLVATPTLNQAGFLEDTLCSVLGQGYKNLAYVVKDGGSTDETMSILSRYRGGVMRCYRGADEGQADAIAHAFELGLEEFPDTRIMSWINSDDLYAPGVLAYVGAFFRDHPGVDVVYGHRILVDAETRELGRWVLPPHRNANVHWVDYVPQETLFWRRRVWDRVGGINRCLHYAMDWDLLLRFQEAGARVVRLPWFLGAFRVHDAQKTASLFHSCGREEIRLIRERLWCESTEDSRELSRFKRDLIMRAALCRLLLEAGLRY